MEMSQQNPLQLLQPNKIVFNKHSKKKKNSKGLNAQKEGVQREAVCVPLME
jgi:hypothetical protein